MSGTLPGRGAPRGNGGNRQQHNQNRTRRSSDAIVCGSSTAVLGKVDQNGFLHGRREGVVLDNGSILSGKFKHGRLHTGKVQWPDGTEYRTFEGHGGSVFDHNNLPQNHGCITYSDGRLYEGALKPTQRGQQLVVVPHGPGLMKETNGTAFNGRFKDGERCGQGTQLWRGQDRRLWASHWDKHGANGRCKYTYIRNMTEKYIYNGGIERNVPVGEGSLTRQNGLEFVKFASSADLAFPVYCVWDHPAPEMILVTRQHQQLQQQVQQLQFRVQDERASSQRELQDARASLHTEKLAREASQREAKRARQQTDQLAHRVSILGGHADFGLDVDQIELAAQEARDAFFRLQGHKATAIALHEFLGYLGKESWQCPIGRDLMVNPIISVHGITFSAEAIEKWLANKPQCPCTRKHLINADMRPNLLAKTCIDLVKEQARAQASWGDQVKALRKMLICPMEARFNTVPKMMRDPVVASDGQTYDRVNLQRGFAESTDDYPLRSSFEESVLQRDVILMPNLFIAQLIGDCQAKIDDNIRRKWVSLIRKLHKAPIAALDTPDDFGRGGGEGPLGGCGK